MRKHTIVRTLVVVVLAFACLVTAGGVMAQQTATGVVYHDANHNGERDAGETGLANIAVSNGRDVVLTDDGGHYQIEIDDDDIIFVIKPRNWMTATDDNGVPRYYYIHKPDGSPDLHYPGVEPTGDLPESVDFPLYSQPEAEQFMVLVFGDPQPRNDWQVDFLANDVLDGIAAQGTGAVMSFALGDIVADRLDLLDSVADAFGTLPVPGYFVLGNHDENYDATDDAYADETWERVFGPATYSLNYGPVHFIVIDDVIWHPGEGTPESYSEWKKQGRYTCGISDEDMEFIRNDLALLPKDQLVVYMFHIPVTSMENREEFLSLFEGRTNVLGLSGHTHTQYSVFVGADAGWPNETPHQHLVTATACGAWWRGDVDEHGIPFAHCRDNVPNGHLELSFDGNAYEIEFVPARRPRSHQMIIWAPQTVAADAETLPVYANIFLGNERSTVELCVDDGEWLTMEPVLRPQDAHAELFAAQRDRALEGVGRADRAPAVLQPVGSRHLWFAETAAPLAPGYHTLRVRTTDMFGHTYHGQRTIRVD
ncbi:MAG: calcineurin-like phosphoesterase C-terminal domain-containing protein [Armatimonadota bacterium]